MKCRLCGGRVEWQGRLSNLTYTKCMNCGERNCQIVEQEPDDRIEHEDGEKEIVRNG
jgi:hypothetical protein